METTQNADAGNHMTGTTNIKKNEDAKQKWAITHGARTFINSHMYDLLNLRKNEDVTNDLHKNAINRFHGQTNKLFDTFSKYTNPFSQDLEILVT